MHIFVTLEMFLDTRFCSMSTYQSNVECHLSGISIDHVDVDDLKQFADDLDSCLIDFEELLR